MIGTESEGGQEPSSSLHRSRMKILVLNSGSSSQKSARFELAPHGPLDPIPALWEGKIEWDGKKQTSTIKSSTGKKIRTEAEIGSGSRVEGVEKLLENLSTGPTALLLHVSEVQAIGHRIVHGGPELSEPTRITPEVRQAI